MAISIAVTHTTAADGTFSPAGAAAWNAAHTAGITGAGTNQLIYSTGATTLAQSSNLTYDGTTFTIGGVTTKAAATGSELIATTRLNFGVTTGAYTLSISSLGAAFLWSSSSGLCGYWNGVNGASRFTLDSKGGIGFSQTQNDATDTVDTSITRQGAGVVQVNNAASAGSAGTWRGKYQSSDGTAGVATFTFTTVDGKTVSGKDGIITSVV